MRLALLTGFAAALSITGAAGARAETIYITDPYAAPAPYADPYAATAPGYVYSVPAPIRSPGYIVSEPGYTMVAPPPPVIAAPPPPVALAPAPLVPPPGSGIVTTGFATTPSCFVDWRGFERCY